MNIVILDGYAISQGTDIWQALASFGTLHLYDRSNKADVPSRIQNADIVIVNKVVLDRETLEQCPRLRLICESATGYNNIDIDACRDFGITVSNVPAYSSASVAQLVFSLLLEMAQQVAKHNSAVHAGAWASCPDFSFRLTPLFELQGKTLGIIGYGDIGQRVANIALAFGMEVLACSRTHRPELARPHIQIVSQAEVLAQSDIISLHCPQNPESYHLICQETLAQMKDGAILINTARGACVVESDVCDALERGKLAFYGADVLAQEPPKANHPLQNAPNCFLTPHMAWMTREAVDRLLETVVENIRAFTEGKPQNVVNP